MSSVSTRKAMEESSLISVIIPAVNEAETLGATLTSVRAQTAPCEIIVVDAQSTDETLALARGADARVISSLRRQRAAQLNLGAQQASGSTLLFLHADTVLPARALDHITAALQDRSIIGGAFTRRYASPSITLRATCRLAAWRNRLIGWHLGDQGMFVRRMTFFQLGGFREVDRFEDLDFSRRLRAFGRTVTLRPCVTSSARRFDRSGPARTTARDLMLTIRYLITGLPENGSSSHAPPSYAQPKRVGNL